ncbi:hypothetical protein BC829DRAFT_96316 [Chytridium lagenaria]|nr:hypothetical protein BC829DRAFT_96316 [Chytridium lagenaria]
MRMIAQELRRNGLRVISAESRVRDADTKATEMKVGLDEAILEEVFKGMVKADVVLICLSPEYVRSPINQLELRNLRRLIDTPVVFAITSSLDSFDHSSDPNPHYPVMDLTTILKHTFSYDYPSSPVIIDLTIPPLFISRCVVLSRALGEAAASYDASCAAKEEEEKHANPPPWQISKVTEGMMNSFTLEGMCLVSTFVEEVLASEDGGKCARQRTAIAGYAWVPHHKEILNRQPTTRKDVCTVALVKETGTNWIASWGWVQGQEEVSNDRAEGISMGKINVWKAWRWIKTIREKVSRAPVMGENRTQINVGARVEVKVLWMEGQYPRFLW